MRHDFKDVIFAERIDMDAHRETQLFFDIPESGIDRILKEDRRAAKIFEDAVTECGNSTVKPFINRHSNRDSGMA